ncbi:MAG TPA: 4Fe-4S dicluster domain-containing protein [Nitrospirae bacterium]|nr:4Fe-4S dicluster domain-containing protein [Nitrospirota bacterium]
MNKIDFDNLKKENIDSISPIERREFLKIGFVVTGIFAGGSVISLISNINKVFASKEEMKSKYPYKPHYSMVMRQDRCVDCELCKEACVKTNKVPDYGYRTTILEKVSPNAVGNKREFIPVLCNQCNNPPCVRACPTKATYKDQKNGIVQMEDKRCLGCKSCVLACPYNARYFNEEKHAIDKCNFCFDTRLTKGIKITACSEACPADVRVFGDLSDPESRVYKLVHQIDRPVWVLREETGVKPNVFYIKG